MLLWSDEQLAAYRALRTAVANNAPIVPPARAKYGNKKVSIDGKKFDSKAEGARYVELKRLQEGGVISGLKTQVPFELSPSIKLNGKKRRSPPLRYFADFVFEKDGCIVIEDCKGVVTEGYRIKRHLMAALGFSIVEITKSRGKRNG